MFDVIKPIWVQLTDKSLLEKCVRGATQNRNEAWNGMLWGICPKTKFFGSEVVRLCAALTCLHYNNGIMAYCAVLETMGIRGVLLQHLLWLHKTSGELEKRTGKPQKKTQESQKEEKESGERARR